MKLGLHISKLDNAVDYSVGRRFRFAVVDLDKGKGYPMNFVCKLPTLINAHGKSESVFLRVFGDKSVEQARALLTGALEMEEDSDVKAEITRRLNLLELKPISQVKCSACGEFFLPNRGKRVKQKFCQECMKKKFGSRE
jgi:ribosomal protein L32